MSLPQLAIDEQEKFTYSDYLLLTDSDKRYEILDGDLLMSPSPTAIHQILLLKMAKLLSTFVEQNKFGQIFIVPFDVVLSDYEVIQPDIIFVSAENSHIIKPTHIQGSPDLLIEILSPSSVQRDRIIKRKIYSRNGVKEYWLINPEQKTIQQFQLQKKAFTLIKEFGAKESLSSSFFPELVIQLENIFD
jgi:Uma2 family endonuclease